ncbi:MAG: sulfite exporter TauE/SafE family protein [Candidatus Nanopelagicaceae bacterium]|nr:sulfite exporter TauE/SafE family protein [Candidatus Nanopelagicaceae bacterium]
MEILLAIVCGVGIGSVLGYVGAGGSMLAVPTFIYIFGLNPVAATTASLIVVFVGAAAGALPKLRRNEILVKEALAIWAIGLTTNLTGAYYLPQIPENVILTGFALVLITAGISMLIPTPVGSAERKVSPVALVAISLVIGALTGLFGIGGGFLAIPILILFYNVAPARAAGTSLFIITINTLTGFFAHFRHWDEVNWLIPALMALMALIVSRYASHHSSKLSPITLKRAFAIFVFAIALFTLVDTWVIT